MKLLKSTTVVLLCCLASCASKQDRLNKEYEKVSKEIEALRDESKATVTLEVSTEKYLKVKREYEVERRKLYELREKHKDQGLPIGPSIDWDLEPEDEPQRLRKHHDKISDAIRNLEKKRKKIVEEQVKS